MRNPVHQVTGSNCGHAKELMSLGSIIQQGSGALFAGKDGSLSESLSEVARDFTHGQLLRTCDIQYSWRRLAMLERSQAHGIGITLPDHIDRPHSQVDGTAFEYRQR